MKYVTRYMAIIIFFLAAHFILHVPCSKSKVPSVFAADEFDIGCDATYEIEPDGSAKVVADISLTNKLSNVYATEYNLMIEKGQIKNIGAWDSKGKIETETERETEQTKVNLKFNDQVVGTGNTLRFTLKYEIDNLAKKSGEIWQVVLPKQTDIQRYSSYKLSLKTPRTFPELAYISPQPTRQTTTNNYLVFSFTQKSLVQNGVVATFGQSQFFDFTLYYHLANPKGKPVYTKIALPPTTQYQKTAFASIDPKPENIEVDQDGNWLAVYTLGPLEKMKVIVQGSVHIFANPADEPVFDGNNLDSYLTPQPFWETNHPEIRRAAQDLKTPAEIYKFVIKTLSYNYEKIKTQQKRLGALEALRKPDQAICMEFTDLFIALARTAGIPAREINGFAYTDNPSLKPLSESADILHSWPEYWDSQRARWVPVDPTWEETSGIDYFSKFDLSHFVFAIHGKDSQFPLAAGSYKNENQTEKDIDIRFGTPENISPAKLDAVFDLPKTIFIERGAKGKIILENLGPAGLFDLDLQIKNQNLKLNSPSEITIAVLPPYAKKEIDLTIGKKFWPLISQATVELLVNNQKFVYNIKVSSLVFHFLLPVAGGLIISSGLLMFLWKYRK